MAVSKTTSKKKTTTKKSTSRVGGTNLVTKHFFKGWMVAVVVLLVAVAGYAVVHYSEASSGNISRADARAQRDAKRILGSAACKLNNLNLLCKSYNIKANNKLRSAYYWTGNTSYLWLCYGYQVTGSDSTGNVIFDLWVKGKKVSHQSSFSVSKNVTHAFCAYKPVEKGNKISAEITSYNGNTNHLILKRVGVGLAQ